jgi:hypothetical protein
MAMLGCFSAPLPIAHAVVDDIDGDQIKGDPQLVEGSVGIIRLSTVGDVDDLHPFDIFFDDAALGGGFGSEAVDAIKVLWLDGADETPTRMNSAIPMPPAAYALKMHDWQMSGIEGGPLGADIATQGHSITEPLLFNRLSPAARSNGTGLIYGWRVLEKNDDEFFTLRGSVLHDLHWRTDVANQILGPQAGLIWLRTQSWWSVHLQGNLIAGYNHSRVEQNGAFAIGLVPGQLNQPLTILASTFTHHESNHDFSPASEVYAAANWQITDVLSFKFVGSGVYVQNVSLVEDRTVYRLPDLGLRDPGTQHLFVYDVFCGIELVR